MTLEHVIQCRRVLLLLFYYCFRIVLSRTIALICIRVLPSHELLAPRIQQHLLIFTLTLIFTDFNN